MHIPGSLYRAYPDHNMTLTLNASTLPTLAIASSGVFSIGACNAIASSGDFSIGLSLDRHV